MLLNCGVGEDSSESLGLQGDQTSQSWMLIGRIDAEAKTPIIWPPDWKNDSLEKTLMLGKTEGGRRGGNRGWDGWMTSLTQWTWVWVNFGVGDGQGGLACCSLWGHKKLDTTEWLNWTDKKLTVSRSLKFLNVVVNWPPVAHIILKKK